MSTPTIKRHRQINTLIPKLMEESKNFRKEFSKRLKINMVFSECEKKASRKFNGLINDSKKRYERVKSDIILKNILKRKKDTTMKEVE